MPLLNHLCSALLHPDETLKASLVNVWLQLLGAPGASAAKSLPAAVRDRLCVLLLQTLANADSPQLVRNSVGEKNRFYLFDVSFVNHTPSSCPVGPCRAFRRRIINQPCFSKHRDPVIKRIPCGLGVFCFLCVFLLPRSGLRTTEAVLHNHK